MPIGTTAAILGGAVIGGGASLIASNKNSKAINQASEANERAAAESVALQREIYGSNEAHLNPFIERGNAAGTVVQGALGLPGGSSAMDAYETFKRSTGYQDRLTEGYRGVNAAYAGRGLLQSGAAQKALLRYGQSQASGEFGNFMGYLGNQQGVGLSAASTLAGVGQSYANNVGAINQGAANFAGQAAVARANNSNSALGGIANIAGNAVGALSSYGAAPTLSPVNFGAINNAANSVRIPGF